MPAARPATDQVRAIGVTFGPDLYAQNHPGFIKLHARFVTEPDAARACATVRSGRTGASALAQDVLYDLLVLRISVTGTGLRRLFSYLDMLKLSIY